MAYYACCVSTVHLRPTIDNYNRAVVEKICLSQSDFNTTSYWVKATESLKQPRITARTFYESLVLSVSPAVQVPSCYTWLQTDQLERSFLFIGKQISILNLSKESRNDFERSSWQKTSWEEYMHHPIFRKRRRGGGSVLNAPNKTFAKTLITDAVTVTEWLCVYSLVGIIGTTDRDFWKT